MPTLLQGIQGFAGASGVGVLCLTALFCGSSVFATNLPTVADIVASNATWSGIVTVPLLVVAYVVGLLAIAIVDRPVTPQGVELGRLDGIAAQRYSQLEQEAEILGGSVIGFVLLAAAAFLNVFAYPGWARTLAIGGVAFLITAAAAWRMGRDKHRMAALLASAVSSRPAESARGGVRP